MDVLLLVALILLNGALAMSEIALIAARRSRLARMAEAGDGAAKAAMALGAEPNRFLSTVQIGITAIGILNGIVGEAALAGPLAGALQSLGLERSYSGPLATVLVVVLITYFTIVVGELVPKRIAQINPEGIARLVARPMQLLATVSRPFVLLLSGSTAALLRLLGQREVAGSRLTDEDIEAMLQEGSTSGVIEEREHLMVRNIFRLDDRQLGSLMVPRSEMVWLDLECPLETNLARMAKSDFARYPLCRGGLDDVVGVAEAKLLLNQMLLGEPIDLVKASQPPVFVPESLTGMELLEQFQATGVNMMIVIDEYGDVQGLVTLRNLVEAVTGEFRPPNREDGPAIQREDGSWLLDGLMPAVELGDRLGLKHLPEGEKGRYHTLSGMMMWLLGRLPVTGDVATWEQWRFEVVDMDGKRIDKVLATPLDDAGRRLAPFEQG